MSADRYRGVLLGLAAGDAVGTTAEFSKPGSFEPLTDMVGGGQFRLPAGAWTDDTSMALCLAESLVERGGFDPVDQLRRYVRWYPEGHLSSTEQCFDIGNATRALLERFERTGERYPGDAAPNAGGNGSLMCLAPVVLAYAGDPERAVEMAALSSRTTPGAPHAHDACRYLAALLLGALRGATKEELLRLARSVRARARPVAIDSAASGDPRGGRAFLQDEAPARDRGWGYAVRALEAALWALASADRFEAGVGPRARPRRSGSSSPFLELRISCFLDLTEEGEGPPLHRYAPLLRSPGSGTAPCRRISGSPCPT